ncbi:DUF2505 domain-containing protein [Crossiella sp. SN42]|uniref:DUF2505 domain-containing protein n=1 Tax=Crossiella sp. SN42 TaxID=2944808 RepID=UPI00207C5D65|nr:DUF2505 domain-containing protein [Crossiella sp. SN42]MCO1579323.1 DUF2505 domain-containing protein [Crossiella sp. SN42]
MATSTETSHGYSFPAARVAATMVDETYLRDRLAAVGGTKAELLSLDVSGAETVLKLRQGIPSDKLPALVRTLISGDLVIERAETWLATGEGATAVVNATVPGAPATIGCSISISPDRAGCRVRAKLTVSVSLPFVGGKVEKAIIEQVQRLLTTEHEFTERWLREHP